MTKLAQFSLGTGDRFARQAAAQLSAVSAAAEQGIALDIVWNKSFREHKTIGSQPASTREAADAAVRAYRNSGADRAWKGNYYLDADHIGLETVGIYLPYAEFYTLDVADAIGRDCDDAYRRQFMNAAESWIGKIIAVQGLEGGITIGAGNRPAGGKPLPLRGEKRRGPVSAHRRTARRKSAYHRSFHG
jgi:hypothetical protein